MRKHTLFFVHGMGSYVNASGTAKHAWSKAAAKSLKEQYDKYLLLRSIPFDDRFDVVHINYDTEFHKLLKRWQDEADTILASGDATPSIVQSMLGWLQGGADTDDNFAWSHVSDVVLYKFFSLVRQRIKIHVANQFRNALAPNADGAVTTWSVIAHSLGTIVAHDVLHSLDSSTPNEAGISILDAMVPSANAVCMLANVSKIMENDVDVYDSLIVPSSGVKPNTACFNYLSCNNKWDPFVRPQRFEPGGRIPWDVAKANGTFLDIQIESVHEINVHTVGNYLVNPAVHIPLLETLCGAGSVLESEKHTAFDEFEDVPDTTIEAAFETLAQKYEDEPWFELIGKLYAELRSDNA